MTAMTSEILEEYNRHIEEQEIGPKNNRDKQHAWEQINSQQIIYKIKK